MMAVLPSVCLTGRDGGAVSLLLGGLVSSDSVGEPRKFSVLYNHDEGSVPTTFFCPGRVHFPLMGLAPCVPPFPCLRLRAPIAG